MTIIDRREDDGSVADLVPDGGQRFDELFDALSDARRRYVLYHLRDETQATVSDVARQVAAWERGTDPADVDEEEIDEVRTALYHNHLPKLREARIVDYDDRTEQLVYRDPPGIVETCLERCRPADVPD